jgi:hypothetical protein
MLTYSHDKFLKILLVESDVRLKPVQISVVSCHAGDGLFQLYY